MNPRYENSAVPEGEETAASNDVGAAEPAKAAVSPSAELVVKHPLESSWTLWFDFLVKKPSSDNWSDNVKPIVTFRYIEDFWGLYNTIVRGSQLPLGSNYHLFREGVKPAWEDPVNANGGKWQLVYPATSPDDFDQGWLTMVLSIIGEQFSDIDGHEVCGAVCSPRRGGLRIAMWTKTGSDRQLQEVMGRRMKALLGISHAMPITFQLHSDYGPVRGNYGRGGELRV